MSSPVELIICVLPNRKMQFGLSLIGWILLLYVVVEELIPEMSQGQHSNIGTLFFALGFSLMMILDVALG